ncbi:DapH/DapD/GlmU-related protein [Methylobacterium frigidaeris]|uniref:Bifunctional protein GlmU n=1 Tax=Methylobacterium frigidaeris TaxID=2038277 RepID=A0AA37HFR2_9HYPH|nr:DapH/DapD/GlmU-related protein [Methylobacterium frigidaeris]PIK71302.1 LpxA family transferase [Methylobacterium frigidaeris]GJD64949.1 Bifunctional protein GlmU [Methylobacterium frigidaeris]
MTVVSLLVRHIRAFPASALADLASEPPWALTQAAGDIVRRLLARLGEDFVIAEAVAVHRSAKVEPGAVLKGPLIVGPHCFIGHGATLRGGAWLDEACTVGPGSELKASFLFAGTALAHFNFVGESVIGRGVNLEAGAVIANHRNEWPGATVAFRHGDALIDTGCPKFGALVGDGARLGANAVVAPGAILGPGTVVPRLGLVDQGVPPDLR